MGFVEFQIIGLNPMSNLNQHVIINSYDSGLVVAVRLLSSAKW